jgi:uncharacterized protein YjbJ (UPF0337 family)
MPINAQELQGQWNRIRGQLKERWGQLTDDDLQIQGGNVDQLIGRIQQRTGEGRDAIERYMSDLMSRGASSIAQATEAVGTYAQQAAGRLREGYEQVSDQARRGYEQVSDQARMHYEQAQDYIQQRPAQTVLGAFGFGLMVGVLVGLALRSR